MVELKKQLEDRDEALTDVRLDALDKAREVDILKETVNRLKSENKQLKQDFSRLLEGHRRRPGGSSRCSSRSSLPGLGDEEPLYEEPPSCVTSKRAFLLLCLVCKVDIFRTLLNCWLQFLASVFWHGRDVA